MSDTNNQLDAMATALAEVLPYHSLACISKINIHNSPWSFDVANDGSPIITQDSCLCGDYIKYLRAMLPDNHPKGFTEL